MKKRGKGEIPEKTRRPAAPSGTIFTCENRGATPAGIESGSPMWKAIQQEEDVLQGRVMFSIPRFSIAILEALKRPLRGWLISIELQPLQPVLGGGGLLEGRREHTHLRKEGTKGPRGTLPVLSVMASLFHSAGVYPPGGFLGESGPPSSGWARLGGLGACGHLAHVRSAPSHRLHVIKAQVTTASRAACSCNTHTQNTSAGVSLHNGTSPVKHTLPAAVTENKISGFLLPTADFPWRSRLVRHRSAFEYQVSVGIQGRWKRDIPVKIPRPAASVVTITTCENQGVVRLEIEPGLPWWEASILTA
ncbi:hypothetical protein PR048_015876 [Dryococelus australis]|uniref:Uncharacterized protein n=1 Tax=Dryococelus australis TaxID=614101 RepID=A0ABQ9HIG8_9NEOP|nr:hypothetical protein PR048_015876 [Dryococelus australis]